MRAEYWHQDHLGNTRLAFSDYVVQDGVIETQDDPNTPQDDIEITQELHYYPFGMEQLGSWYSTVAPDNDYRYNGKELNEDYGMDLYEYGFRWYDAAIGRFTGVDPIADDFPWVNTYNYAENEPVANIDLHGLQQGDNMFTAKIKTRIENAIKAAREDVSNAFEQAGNFIYDKVIGNDVIGNTIDGTELITDNLEKVAEGAKALGTIFTVAEGGKVLNDNLNAETPEQKEAAGQDAAKFLLELGISVGASAASIPANILINTSKDGDVVTSPENIDRAAGAFEQSINPAREMIQERIDKRNKEKN